MVKNNEKTIHIGGSEFVYIIHISKIKICLISKGHVWIRISMPAIYSDNVAKRTWEYAGSHRSNVVCMSNIFSSAWHSIYIKRCLYDRRYLSRQSGSQICNTEASWKKCVKWEKTVKHIKMCHWHYHCQREVGMAFVSNRRSMRCIFQVEKREHPTERWIEGEGCPLDLSLMWRPWLTLKQPGWYLFAELPRLCGMLLFAFSGFALNIIADLKLW